MPDYLPVFTSPQGETETLRAYQAVLDCWPVPFTELDVPTRFGQTHVIASGPESAPPVILLHAYFATAMAWYRIAGALSQHYRTYAVDIIGEANKSRPTRAIASLDDSLQWFTELLQGLQIEQTCLVGNSFGGFVATYYAMHLKERILKLALIGPAATFHGMPQFYLHMFAPKMLYLFLPWLPGQKRTMQGTVDWMQAGLPGEHLWEKLFYLVMVHGTSRVQIFPRVYKPDELAQIRGQTLLILGAQEQIYPPEQAAQAAKRLLPSIQVEMIPQAHHIAAIAQPDKVGTSLLRFFQSK